MRNVINKEDLIYIGYLKKLHGVRGEVVMLYDADFTIELDAIESLFIEIEGLPVPFFLAEDGVRVIQNGKSTFVHLTFNDIDNEPKATRLLDSPIYIEKRYLQTHLLEENSPVNQYAGYTVVDEHLAEIGTIKYMIDIPQNPLFCLLHNNREVLIPAHKDIILEIDTEQKKIRIKLQDGLLDL